MRSTHEVTVPLEVSEVWSRLPGAAVGAAMPGAEVDQGSRTAAGSWTVRLGSHQVTYRLTVAATGVESDVRSAVLEVGGKQARGSGTLTGSVQVSLTEQGEATELAVVVDVEATGRGESATTKTWSRALDNLVTSVGSSLTADAPDDVAPAPTPRPAPVAPAPPTPPTPGPAEPPPPARPVAEPSRPAPAPAPQRAPVAVAPAPAAVPSSGDATVVRRVVPVLVLLLGGVLLIRRRRRRRA